MKISHVLAAGAALLGLAACGRGEARQATPGVPAAASAAAELAALRQELDAYPDYSIILHGLRTEGKSAFHQYKLVWQDTAATSDSLRTRVRFTDWTPITRELYRREQPQQGLAVYTRKAGVVDSIPAPPVYAYVGDPRYGRWDNVNGTPAWVFAAQYALMAHALDELGDYRYRRSQPTVIVVQRSEYDRYRSAPGAYRDGYRTRYREHASANPAPPQTFSAKVASRMNGASATGKPSFVERAQARQAAGASRFQDKVRSRMNGDAAATPQASAPGAVPSAASSSRSPSSSSSSWGSRPRGSRSWSSGSRRSSGSSWGASRSRSSRRRF
jgi:hypothetical protein